MDINLTIEQASEAAAVMRLAGEVNASNFMEIVDKAGETYKNPARYLIIDLSDVASISSTGMVALHKIALIYSGVPQDVEENENPDFTHSQEARKFVKLLNPQPGVDESLTKAGMKLFFKFYDDLDSALKSI
jgi:anti-anti-sigma regulatory factor